MHSHHKGHPQMHPHQMSQKAAAERGMHDSRMVDADFSKAPFTIAWEITRACAFACVHCRADAQHKSHPDELRPEESLALITRLKEFGNPILIFTGGDPMMRRDLIDLVSFAAQSGLRCSLTPTATALPTKPRLEALKDSRDTEAGIEPGCTDPHCSRCFSTGSRFMGKNHAHP
jgi:AdoMet-dependent heme synthase